MTNLDIGLIGYGEVGKVFGSGLRTRGVAWVGAWDVRFVDAALSVDDRRHAQAHGVIACESMRQLCSKANLIIAAVTSANTLQVAQEAARWIGRGASYLDLNAASPAVKRQAAMAIEDAGAHYIEAGVTTAVPPFGIAVPMLIGGKQAQRLADRLRPIGFNVTPLSPKIGAVAAAEMSRGILARGIETLIVESFTTARRYGVEDAMLASLAESFPGTDWRRQAGIVFGRAAQGGERRMADILQAAATIRSTGIEPLLSDAIAARQLAIAHLSNQGVFADVTQDADWRDYADRIIARTPLAGKPGA